MTLSPLEDSSEGNIKPQQQREEENKQTISVSLVKQTIVVANLTTLRYVPESRREDGESPFSECVARKSTTRPISKFNKTDRHVLKDKGALPTHKAGQSKVTRAPLLGFISSKGLL